MSNGEEEYLSCPYDLSHRIMRYRMQKHIARCKVVNFAKKQLYCMYNNSHLVYEPEYQFHIETCKDRILLDKFVITPTNVDLDKFPVEAEIPAPSHKREEDDWENDTGSYDAAANCANKPLLVRKDVASEAKRKDFRMNERRRFQDIMGNSNNALEEIIISENNIPKVEERLSKGMKGLLVGERDQGSRDGKANKYSYD